MMGVSPDALQRYIREENEPTFVVMARLSRASGYSLEWLATGEGPEAAPESRSQGVRVDAEILGKAVYVLDGVLRQNQSHMEPQDYAETLLMLVQYLRENAGGLSPGNVVNLMDFVRKRQRNGPRQPDPATGPEI
jgi:transcriptional regulator with XRE-family HTH domain